MFESDWNRLLTLGNISFRDSVSLQFERTMDTSLNTDPSNPNSHPVKRVPPSIPPQPSKEQLKKLRNHQTCYMAKDASRTNPTKSFAQVIALVVNIFKIKEAFSCHNLAKWLSHYLYFFSFSFGLTTQERSVGKCHMSQERCHSMTSHKSIHMTTMGK